MRGYFFNAQPTTDFETHPTGYDREYDAIDYNLVMGTFFHNGIFANLNPDACKVAADEVTVTFMPGVALINGGQAHFDPEDSLELSEGDGKYSIMCRKNTAAEVRAFELVALKGADYPAPVREGDIYDLCLAHVLVDGGTATVTDTRSDRDICGFAAVVGQPPYQPSTGVPALLWDYTLFPGQLTAEQRQIVETTPSLMEMFEASRPKTDWFTKLETVSPAVAALYGLGPDAVPGEVLAQLGTIGIKIKTFTSNGVFTAPKTGSYLVEVVGGGGASTASNTKGGGGGYARRAVALQRGDTVSVTVGTGGQNNSGTVTPGGTSSFGNHVSASGGGDGGGGSGIGGDINISGASQMSNAPGGSMLSSSGSNPKGYGVGGRHDYPGTPGVVVVTYLG